MATAPGPGRRWERRSPFLRRRLRLWYHRGCASIPPALYKSLSNSNDPLVCLACTNVHLKQEIYQLKNELAGMINVRDKCSALAAEVTTLRELVGSLVKDAKLSSKPNVRPNAAKSKRPYTTTVTTSTTVPLPAAAVSRPTAPGRTGPENPSITRLNIASGESNKSRVKVDGARKIWGTVPTCSAGAIATTISKLVPTKLQLRIRRKMKMLSNNKVVWWFIVHGEELSDLSILERDWDKVEVQTLWSLESCYMSSNAAQSGSQSSPIISVSIPHPTICIITYLKFLTASPSPKSILLPPIVHRMVARP